MAGSCSGCWGRVVSPAISRATVLSGTPGPYHDQYPYKLKTEEYTIRHQLRTSQGNSRNGYKFSRDVPCRCPFDWRLDALMWVCGQTQPMFAAVALALSLLLFCSVCEHRNQQNRLNLSTSLTQWNIVHTIIYHAR